MPVLRHRNKRFSRLYRGDTSGLRKIEWFLCIVYKLGLRKSQKRKKTSGSHVTTPFLQKKGACVREVGPTNLQSDRHKRFFLAQNTSIYNPPYPGCQFPPSIYAFNSGLYGPQRAHERKYSAPRNTPYTPPLDTLKKKHPSAPSQPTQATEVTSEKNKNKKKEAQTSSQEKFQN